MNTIQSFKTSFTVLQSPVVVFDAINNVRGWWGPIEGDSEKVGDEFIYRYGELHYSKHRIVESIPGERVVLLTVDSALSFVEPQNEWDGTRIVFEISKRGEETVVTFVQEGLVPEMACYNDCSNAWSYFVNKSLQQLIVEGKGAPDWEGD